ncbi:MAG: hypothetical protein ABSB71_08455 [Candidatus Bathyarchaeia archaeon]|jgi:hypothetical protein
MTVNQGKSEDADKEKQGEQKKELQEEYERLRNNGGVVPKARRLEYDDDLYYKIKALSNKLQIGTEQDMIKLCVDTTFDLMNCVGIKEIQKRLNAISTAGKFKEQANYVNELHRIDKYYPDLAGMGNFDWESKLEDLKLSRQTLSSGVGEDTVKSVPAELTLLNHKISLMEKIIALHTELSKVPAYPSQVLGY